MIEIENIPVKMKTKSDIEIEVGGIRFSTTLKKTIFTNLNRVLAIGLSIVGLCLVVDSLSKMEYLENKF